MTLIGVYIKLYKMTKMVYNAKFVLRRNGMILEKVVIIIPTYNEALVIQETLSQLFQAASSITTFNIHVLIFDSNSEDDTQQIVLNLIEQNQNLHLITESKKSGLGSAYLQAMRYAINEMSADIVFEFDADLSHQPKYIAPILEKLKSCDVVVGSRYVRGGTIPNNWGWHRKLLSALGNYTARLFLTPKYKDFTSGFRATRSQALLKALPKEFLCNHYAYKLHLFWLLHKTKARICEFPIEFVDRTKGESKLPANSIFDALRVLGLLRYYECKRYLKMCLVGLSGVVLQYFIYNLLRQSMPPVNALQLAVIAAIINNYILNNHYTFKRKTAVHRYEKIRSFSLYIGYSIAMIYIQSYWLLFGINYFGSGYLKENLIILMGIILGSVLNYITFSNLIWRKKLLQD
jgi:dolichol-phosphate mannosyltransferase